MVDEEQTVLTSGQENVDVAVVVNVAANEAVRTVTTKSGWDSCGSTEGHKCAVNILKNLIRIVFRPEQVKITVVVEVGKAHGTLVSV